MHLVRTAFGRAVRDLFLRMMFQIIAKRDAMPWIHEYRIDWDSPLAALAPTESTPHPMYEKEQGPFWCSPAWQ